MNTNNVVRVYPIRKTKSEWSIPLYCYHVCNSRCSTMYIRDDTDLSILRYILVDNPNYVDNKCPNSNQLERTFVSLSTFDMENPIGGTGPLYEPNAIVIPDTYFLLRITYPLSHHVNVTVKSQSSNGFTLAELLYSIQILYYYIYQEEERTSTTRCYHLKKECSKCSIKQYIDNLQDCEPKEHDSCSICYNEYEKGENVGKLLCNHFYHKKCILKWMETSKTCPLCRKNVVLCDECNGSGMIYYDYNGIVIPIEHRGTILNRNTTNGIFGIFGHDLEDLVIEYINYNRIEKRLTINIGS